MFGPPVEIEMSIKIDAPPSQVWGYLVDWEHLDRWMREAKRFRLTSKMDQGVGVTAEATICIAGFTTTDLVQVTRWRPPEELEIQHLGWVSGQGLMLCMPAPWGTFLYWKETLEPPLGIAGAAGLRLLRPLMFRIFQGDLRLLKDLVESTARASVQ
ncbi:MAG: SRPBCC family protein [Actinomycetota bacterium]